MGENGVENGVAVLRSCGSPEPQRKVCKSPDLRNLL